METSLSSMSPASDACFVKIGPRAAAVIIPDFITHYYVGRPFRSLTELAQEDCWRVLEEMGPQESLPRRLRSDFYFAQRRRYEQLMRQQFIAKGGQPSRRVPHYAILGESEIWARIRPSAIRIPLAELPESVISFTYTDSFANYVDQDLDGKPIPRKPQYETLYLRDELLPLFCDGVNNILPVGSIHLPRTVVAQVFLKHGHLNSGQYCRSV